MSSFTTFSNRLSAFAAAVALSLVLFTQTVDLPQTQLAATSFVGALA